MKAADKTLGKAIVQVALPTGCRTLEESIRKMVAEAVRTETARLERRRKAWKQPTNGYANEVFLNG